MGPPRKPLPSKNNKNFHSLNKTKDGLENKHIDKGHGHDALLSCEQIKQFLCNLETNHPDRIQVKIIGESREKRPIFMAIITEQKQTTTTPKMATLIEAGSNGCNWMAVATALYLIDFLIKSPCTVKIMDFLVIPCSNPDAYESTLTNRKSENISLSLANNFPVNLGLNDMRSIPTEDFIKAIMRWKVNYDYKAQETLSFINTVESLQFAIKLFISLQEEGEKIVYPYGFCGDEIVDAEDLKNVAKQGQIGVRRRFEIGSIYDRCGLTYGTVADFLKTSLTSIRFVYIIHIKAKNETVPANQISCYGEDLMICIKSMAKNVHSFYTNLQARTC